MFARPIYCRMSAKCDVAILQDLNLYRLLIGQVS